MTTLYLDSSAILRYLFGQPGYIDIRQADVGVASTLVEAECLRRFDRARLAQEFPEPIVMERRLLLEELCERLQFVEITRGILRRAGAPLPVALGTLDAIHLVTALQWRETYDAPLAFSTHDHALAHAARLHGFAVMGSEAA